MALLTSARAWRGSGVSLANIARGLAERGHRPVLLAGEPAVVETFAGLGLPTRLVGTGDTGLREAWGLRRVLHGVAADVVLVDRPRDLRLAALAALARPVAIVNRYNLSRRRPPPDLLSRLAYARVRLTVFVSEASARQALAGAGYLRRKPHRVIPGGVDTGHFRPDPAAAALFRAAYGLAGPPYLLAVGSLTGDKRYGFLLEVVARLGADAPVFVVCGDGPLRASLEEQARRLGVAARFLGLVPHDLLPGAYGGASCLLHGCAVETFGLSVLEAMACGTPVLAVLGGAVPEVLDGAGLLAPPEDREAAAGHVRALLAAAERRRTLGSLGRARAVEHFSVEAMRRAYADAIESLVS